MLRRKDSDGNRWQLWPISLRWGHPDSSARWFTTHGWSVGSELVPVEKTAHGYMPGHRGLYGQTLHFGRLKVCFGKVRQ